MVERKPAPPPREAKFGSSPDAPVGYSGGARGPMDRGIDLEASPDGPPRRDVLLVKESRCRFCRDKVERVDYKDVLTLEGLCRSRGRIMAGKRSGTCATHQRMVKRAIKQARFIGLMSYTDAPQRGGFSSRRPW